MKRKRVIVWFRQDLRLHDNVALTDAIKNGEEVIPVYVFDERVFKGKSNQEILPDVLASEIVHQLEVALEESPTIGK